MTARSAMGMFGGLLLGAAAALGAAPAAAADVAHISCPVDSLDAAERERLVDHVRRQAPATDPAMQRFYQTVSDCGRRHGWSDEAARDAIVHNLAEIGQRQARRTLEQRGVDVAAIERALLADAAVVASARSEEPGDVMTAFFARLDARLRAPIEGDESGDAAELLGAYLLYRSAVETSRADFRAR